MGRVRGGQPIKVGWQAMKGECWQTTGGVGGGQAMTIECWQTLGKVTGQAIAGVAWQAAGWVGQKT